jgi:predicted ribosomally synthesized peptide with nif11-like leader
MSDLDPSPGLGELRAFRYRLRHDHLLRQRLRFLKQEATVALARELGFEITIDDLRSSLAKRKQQTIK